MLFETLKFLSLPLRIFINLLRRAHIAVGLLGVVYGIWEKSSTLPYSYYTPDKTKVADCDQTMDIIHSLIKTYKGI